MATTARQAVIEHRFMHPGESDEYDVWARVATHWATTPEEQEAFHDMLVLRRAFPNTPAIANAGREVNMGSACFVLPIEDSMEGIMETLKDAALVQKSGGGTGFDFSELRPEGSTVRSTGRPAPGPASFLRMYSNTIAHVTQAGMRPGANMCVIRCDHPDVHKVLDTKLVEGDVTNFNISVACTDDFMDQVIRRDPAASVLWERITWGAWANGEPGVLFIDTVNRAALHPEVISATNPCGEVPLLPYEACVLGSVNLAEHVVNGRWDYAELDHTVRTLTTLLDNVIDLQTYPLQKIERCHKRYRKIGVGVMGYADALVKMGLRYGSSGAITAAEEAMKFVQAISYDQSQILGAKRGYYPAYTEGMPKRRNLMCQVIAPTGTISRLAGCSFGIEPIFAAEWDGYILGSSYKEWSPYANQPAFVTAKDVTPLEHVLTQATFQEYTDQAVSKTVNLPADTSVERVSDLYITAYVQGCKGITVLRDQSRVDVVIDPACQNGVCSL